MRIIGIDPGKKGAIAYCVDGIFQVWPMPNTEHDIATLISDCHFKGETFCYLEQVHSMPGQGVKSMFTFGEGYGFLRGCLVSNKIPFEDVRPQTWQKHLRLPSGRGLSKTQKKNKLKAKAQQLFPHIDITLTTADALLIAEYGRRMYERQKAGKRAK